MESLVMQNIFGGVYYGKKILLTGHTGFKGSWLTYWLHKMGAEVHGLSLGKISTPNHYDLLNLPINSITADIRNYNQLNEIIGKIQPEIVFHLAAQSLVRPSYKDPLSTLETNIIGTANILQACRDCVSVRAIINVTSDKCYENKETGQSYNEKDPMGGYDPYSVSKGCSELITNSFRNSFFNITDYNIKHKILLASGRAGNVIGGGDWAEDRLIPDTMRAVAKNKQVIIRYPKATRPWQHVLEPLSGYLLTGQKLMEGNIKFATGWNFGPLSNESYTVEEILIATQSFWPNVNYLIEKSRQPHEAKFLQLDCSNAFNIMNWQPVWDHHKTIEYTICWYKDYYLHNQIDTCKHIETYVQDAKDKKYIWTT
jgi:CDP-glucose 4,6-dehydratase